MGQILEKAAARYGEREAVVSLHQGVRLTYHELLAHVNEVQCWRPSAGPILSLAAC